MEINRRGTLLVDHFVICGAICHQILKNHFGISLVTKGKTSKTTKAFSKKWIRDFNEYEKELQPGGSMVEFDAMSLEVFPRRYKFASKDKSNYKPCIRCGELFQYTLLNKTQGYCLYCASKIMVHGYPTTCIDCGAKIKYSIADAYYKHKPKPGERCPGCQERYEKRKKG